MKMKRFPAEGRGCNSRTVMRSKDLIQPDNIVLIYMNFLNSTHTHVRICYLHLSIDNDF